MKIKSKQIFIVFNILLLFLFSCSEPEKATVTIKGQDFYINDQITYKGQTWQGNRVEGLLMNARLVQGIFDDENPETASRWKYPDNDQWDPHRNTEEFVGAMLSWKAHGLLSFTINMQGGSPMGYGNKNWKNTPYTATGELKPAYMERLKLVLDQADSLQMAPILGLFYFGQDEYLEDEAAIKNAANNVIDWLHEQGYKNVLIEVANEIDNRKYDHDLLSAERAHELIELVKSNDRDGFRYLVSTSYNGNSVPRPNVVKTADFLLIHGNGVHHPDSLRKLIRDTRAVEGFQEMPVLINEDDHYDFHQPDYNLKAAVEEHVSWGYFDFRRNDDPFEAGFQSVPVSWEINHERKEAFFDKIKEITGGQ